MELKISKPIKSGFISSKVVLSTNKESKTGLFVKNEVACGEVLFDVTLKSCFRSVFITELNTKMF